MIARSKRDESGIRNFFAALHVDICQGRPHFRYRPDGSIAHAGIRDVQPLQCGTSTERFDIVVGQPFACVQGDLPQSPKQTRRQLADDVVGNGRALEAQVLQRGAR